MVTEAAERESGGDQTSILLFGVLNVTPDSFSDGGEHRTVSAALARAEEMVAQGADVIDVGGESTRPSGKTYGAGAEEVSATEELARIMPVVKGLVARGICVSVDTKKAPVAERVLSEGAQFINDVSSKADPSLLDAVAQSGAQLIRMHSRGQGEVEPPNTDYGDVVEEVVEELREELSRAVDHGVGKERVWLDPGLGFAKTGTQSLELLRRTEELVATGLPVLIGASRKSFLAAAVPNPDGSTPGPRDRLGASTTAVTWAVLQGAQGVRVHDVSEARQAARLASLLRDGGRGPVLRRGQTKTSSSASRGGL